MEFKVSEMSSISTLEFAWENRSLWPSDDWDDGWAGEEEFFCQRVALTNKLELLKWVREEKKCEWDGWTINVAAEQGNLEMIKYCVANECPIDELACEQAASEGHLECLKYLREEAKAPWRFELPLGRLDMVIFTYSNILLSVKYDQLTRACDDAADERPLRLFEVLARNRQSAVGRLERIPRTQAQPDRMFTIPPRQQLSSTTRLAIRTWRVTHFINTYKQTKLFLTETHTYSTQKCSHY